MGGANKADQNEKHPKMEQVEMMPVKGIQPPSLITEGDTATHPYTQLATSGNTALILNFL